MYIALKDSGDFSKIVEISLKSGNFFTCNNVSDRFDEGSKSRDVREAVLPHWQPYYQTTSQSEGQVWLLEKGNIFTHFFPQKTACKHQKQLFCLG